MEAILYVLLTSSHGPAITSQRLASMDECKAIVKTLPHLGYRSKAFCIPVEPFEIVTHEQVMGERK